MEADHPIGVFDSGIGGLTLANAVRNVLPNESIFYFGDTAHLPYGDKSTAAIQAYSIKICNVLLSQNCKAILIACNSASSAAFELVKEYVGSKAIVINVIDPVVDIIANQYANKKIGLIGTRRTIMSNVYKTKIDAKSCGIDLRSVATPLLASMIEEGFYNNSISNEVITEYLRDGDLQDIEALILGCTHYPLIKSEIEGFYKGKVDVIDSSEIVALALRNALLEKGLLSSVIGSKHTFYVSDYTNSFHRSTSMFFGEEVALKHYRLWE